MCHRGLTRWIPLRPYPDKEADLQAKSKIQTKEKHKKISK